MAKTIAELRQELARQEQRVGQLEAQRKQLASQLAAVEKEIQSLTGKSGAAPRPARRAKKAGRKAAAAPRRRGRKGKGRSGQNLNDVLATVLQGKGPVKVIEATELARQAGYKSQSNRFGNIVSQTLAGDSRFRKVARGVYELANSTKRESKSQKAG